MTTATYSSRRKDLVLTAEDLLWLGRAYSGEHGFYTEKRFQAFAWCLINRYLLHPGTTRWPSFVYMLRHFSQPINPRWMRGGDKAESNKYKDTKWTTKRRLDKRERLCKKPWASISKRVRVALAELLAGRILPPPECYRPPMIPQKITNFAKNTASRRLYYPHGFNVGGNWYFEDAAILHRDRVTVSVNHWYF